MPYSIKASLCQPMCHQMAAGESAHKRREWCLAHSERITISRFEMGKRRHGEVRKGAEGHIATFDPWWSSCITRGTLPFSSHHTTHSLVYRHKQYHLPPPRASLSLHVQLLGPPSGRPGSCPPPPPLPLLLPHTANPHISWVHPFCPAGPQLSHLENGATKPHLIGLL